MKKTNSPFAQVKRDLQINVVSVTKKARCILVTIIRNKTRLLI